MKTVLSILNRETWTQDRLAVDANGVGCDPLSPEAVKFCLLGAIYRTYKDDFKAEATAKVYSCIESDMSITSFNDNSSWEEVEALIKKAGI